MMNKKSVFFFPREYYLMEERERYLNKFSTNYELTGAKSDEWEVTPDGGFSVRWLWKIRKMYNDYFYQVKYI